MFSSHFRLFHIVDIVLTGFQLIVKNIESAFQYQNIHQNFDWLLQQMKNPYKWPLLSAMVTIVLPLFNHNNKKAEPFPAQQTSWFSSSSNTYSSVYHLCLQLDEYEIIIHYNFQ